MSSFILSIARLVGFGLALVAFALPGRAETILLTDNYSVTNSSASTFNRDNATTQGGTLATIDYTLLPVNGQNFVAQHGNGGGMLLANTPNGGGAYGNASLNRNFALDANLTDQPLRISFRIAEVSNYTDSTRWAQFNVGSSQNLDVANGGVGLGILFRQNGGGGMFSGGAELGGSTFSWSVNDLVTVLLTDTAGTGSPFDGNGSRATVQVGSTVVGAFTLPQQSTAYATFSAFNYANNQFGVGKFSNLSVALVPEPGMTGLGCLTGLLAAVSLRRRRS